MSIKDAAEKIARTVINKANEVPLSRDARVTGWEGSTLGRGGIALVQQARLANKVFLNAELARDLIKKYVLKVRQDTTLPADVQYLADQVNTTRSDRGYFIHYDSPESFVEFQFNPANISDRKDNKFTDIEHLGRQYSDPIYLNGGARVFSFSLWFDASNQTNHNRFRPKKVRGNQEYLSGRHFFNDSSKDVASVARAIDNSETFKFSTNYWVEELKRYTEPGGLEKDNRGRVAPRFVSGIPKSVKQFSAPPKILFIWGDLICLGYLQLGDVKHTLFAKDLRPLRSECQITFRVIESIIPTPKTAIEGI
jgi:hypothetical protein